MARKNIWLVNRENLYEWNFFHWHTAIVIVSIKFETKPKMYIEIARYLT